MALQTVTSWSHLQLARVVVPPWQLRVAVGGPFGCLGGAPACGIGRPQPSFPANSEGWREQRALHRHGIRRASLADTQGRGADAGSAHCPTLPFRPLAELARLTTLDRTRLEVVHPRAYQSRGSHCSIQDTLAGLWKDTAGGADLNLLLMKRAAARSGHGRFP